MIDQTQNEVESHSQQNQSDAEIDEISLREAVDHALDQFDDVVCVVVHHLPYVRSLQDLVITVYTGHADSEGEWPGVFGHHIRVRIARPDAEPLRLPVRVHASCGGPQERNDLEMTTVFMTDEVIGARPLTVEKGVGYLEKKLARGEDWEYEPPARIPLKKIHDWSK